MREGHLSIWIFADLSTVYVSNISIHIFHSVPREEIIYSYMPEVPFCLEKIMALVNFLGQTIAIW